MPLRTWTFRYTFSAIGGCCGAPAWPACAEATAGKPAATAAPSRHTTSAATAALNATRLSALARRDVVRVPILTRQILDQQRLWIGIQRPSDGIHGPRLHQDFRIVDGRLPDERIS